jgi:hypothetical protein
MGLLSSKQTKLASELIENGFQLEESNNRHVLRLKKDKTTIVLFPKKQN